MNWEAKPRLEALSEDFSAMLYEVAEVIRKSRATLTVAEIDELYKVLGCVAADLSVFDEVVSRIGDNK